MEQLHSKFKVFVLNATENGSDIFPEDFHLTMNGFISLNKVAVKSVSVEHFDNDIIVSLGYIHGQESYPVSLSSVNLGTLPLKEGMKLSDELEKALNRIVDGEDESVICHDFFVNKDRQFIAVFLKTGLVK
jgi:hypothetical protein